MQSLELTVNKNHAISTVLALALLSGCNSTAPNAQQQGGSAATTPSCQFVQDGWGPAGKVPLKVDQAITGLEVPWALAFLRNGDWLVTERPGRIRLVQGGKLVPQPVATINVGEGGEGGLLGVALHPQFDSNRLFYVYYTAVKNGSNLNRVERYTLSEDHLSATPDRIILDDIAAGTFHNGGRIHFGPDGMLYIGTGDARTPDNAQDPASPNGKILRVDPDGNSRSVFASGIRNLEAFDWANPNVIVYADNGPTGELGLTGLDRVGFARAGDNLGWPLITGCQTRSGLVTPALSWNTAAPPGGGTIYRGSAIPEFDGNFIIGMLGTGEGSAMQLHRVVFNPDTLEVTQHEVYLQNQYGRLRDVIQGPDGALYVTTSNCDSRGTCPADGDSILRITHG